MSKKDLTGSQRTRLLRLRDAAFWRQNGKCYWCDVKMFLPTSNRHQTSPFLCTGDHILERSKGGKTTRENIVAACKLCNDTRSNPSKIQSTDFLWSEG